MFSNIDKSLFFIASFSPLWAIMIISYMVDNSTNLYSWIVSLILSGIILVSIFVVRRKFRTLRGSSNSKRVEVTQTREITAEYVPYIMAYLFPIFIQFDDASRIITGLLAIGFVAMLYIKTRLVLTNPALLLVGFRLYEVHAKNYERPFIIISKHYPAGDTDVRDMAHDLCIEKKPENH